MAQIAQAWKTLPDANKATYEAQAEKAKADFQPVHTPVAPFPTAIKLKDEAALDALVKKVSEDAIRDLGMELLSKAEAEDLSPLRIPKVGSFAVVPSMKKGASFEVVFKPSVALKPQP